MSSKRPHPPAAAPLPPSASPGMHRLCAVARQTLGTLLLAGCGGAATSAPLPPPSPPHVATPVAEIPPAGDLPALVARLGASRFEDREEAERALMARAPGDYEAIALLREDVRDLEVQSRLDRILSCPRIIFSSAWAKAEREGTLETALGERFFRIEHEELPTGYERVSARRETREGRPVLVCTVEFEGAFGGDYSHTEIGYVCGEDLRPLSLWASLYPIRDKGFLTVAGTLGPGGWTLRCTGGEKASAVMLPWDDSHDFPYEVALPLTPLWVLSGAPGREILQGDIEFPSLEVKQLILRDEGGTPRRASMRMEGEDKPRSSALLDKQGGLEILQSINNLRAVRISPEEGRRLKDGLAKEREAAQKNKKPEKHP